jgi:hypothetical protein
MDTVVNVQAGQTFEIGISLSEDSIEEYQYVNTDSITETRTEEPYVNWYATHGTVAEGVTLHPYLTSTWIAPQETGITGTWWTVIRDRRGGLNWSSQTFNVIP